MVDVISRPSGSPPFSFPFVKYYHSRTKKHCYCRDCRSGSYAVFDSYLSSSSSRYLSSSSGSSGSSDGGSSSSDEDESRLPPLEGGQPTSAGAPSEHLFGALACPSVFRKFKFVYKF